MFKTILLLLILSQYAYCESIRPGSNNINFIQDSFMFNKEQDGIVVVTLKSDKKVVICNNDFNDFHASLVCNSIGYSSKALSIVTKKGAMVRDMEMIIINCIGKETEINQCSVVNNTNLMNKCRKNNAVAHVYCLGKKLTNIYHSQISATSCTNTDPRIRLVKLPYKSNTGFLQIRHNNYQSFQYVCNQNFQFGIDQAKYFCKVLCQNPRNPKILMFVDPSGLSVTNGYYSDITCPSTMSSLNSCGNLHVGSPCDPMMNVALTCGDETEKRDPPPNVICTNKTAKIEWSTNQQFFINSSMVMLDSNHTHKCNYTREDVKDKIVVTISLNDCNPIITDSDKDIIYKYNLIRQYANLGAIQFKTFENFDIFCEIPKSSQISKEYKHEKVTYPPVSDMTTLKVTLSLHSEPSFQQFMKQPFYMKFNKMIYAKAETNRKLNSIRLSFKNCFITSANSYKELNDTNKATIIENFCPSKHPQYQVAVSYINKDTVGLQFKTFKIAKSTENKINLICETEKCQLSERTCGICRSNYYHVRRTKRSALVQPRLWSHKNVIQAGPIYLI